ncbi:MAG TPA: segregation/condensation protein A [Candidatus Acidoferrum sp.]|nr:segregation/condensation protein A [Candidatus Acidoferrum sp.]
MTYQVKLEMFEGPPDLLLHLIREHQLNILDIPMAKITEEYLRYLALMQELDLDVAGEFLLMAATLIHIKSKMLLPVDPELEKISPEEDPRKELVERLLEHEKYKNAAEMLQQKRMLEEAAWSNPNIKEFQAEDDQPGLAVTLFDLVKTFQQVLDRAKNRPTYEVGKEDVTVPDMIHFVRNLLERTPRSKAVSVTEMFEQQRSRRAMICLFLALLELVKRQAVLLKQADAFGDISVQRSSSFSEAFQNEGADAAVEEEYK